MARSCEIAEICSALHREAKPFEPMAIPDGEKGTIKDICEKENKDGLFNAETAFDRAWKKGIGKLWQMENHNSYAHRGNN